MFLYARNNNSSTAPTLDTSGSVNYNFTNGVLTGTIPTGWTQLLPDVANGNVLWAIQAVAVNTTTSDNILNTEWNAAKVLSINGTNGNPGAPGISVFVATVYLQSATLPDTPSATTSSYNFTTNVLTPPTGWSSTQPATTTTPTYACNYTFTGAPGATATGTGNWSTPYIEAVNGTPGAPGEYRDVIQLYLTSGTVPTAPTSIPYNFSTNTIGTQTGGTAGWSLTRPTATTTPTYVITALAATTTPATDVTLSTWTTPVIAAQVGTNGAPGTRGTRQLYSSSTSYTSLTTYVFQGNPVGAPSYAVAATALIAAATVGSVPTTPIKGDTVTFSNGTDFVYTITYNSDTTAWEPPGTVIDGSLLVTGSVTAAKINSNGLEIKNAQGVVLFSAGVPLDFSNVGGTTKPANNATVGAQAGVNLKDSSGTTIADDGFRNNLINVDWWKRGASIPWTINGEENFIYAINPSSSGGDINSAIGPRGGNDLVWYCREVTGDGQQGGGWDANISSTLDPNKTYRFVVPIRIAGTTTNGNAYWGTQNVCNLNTTTINTNPYFANIDRGLILNGRWYLFVGYVFPYGSTNNSNASAGIWDCKTGSKIANGTNYCHGTATTAANVHRAYQYYAAINSVQYFGRPMINLVDGTEPSLREYFEPSALLNQSITVDANGILQGTGAEDIRVDNSTISVAISSSGTLTASGGPTASGSVSLTGLGGISKSSADTLSAVLSADATTVAGLRAGDLVWNASGVRTSGKGVALTQNGIVGHNGVNATFVINATTGEATFGGALSAASGTFAGALSAATGTFAGTLDADSITTGTLRAGRIDVTKLIGSSTSITAIGSGSFTVPAGQTRLAINIRAAGGGGSGGDYVAPTGGSDMF